MKKVGTRVHLSLYEDETSALCHWQIPEAHFLESWSDVRADDGTVTIIQPLIAPLYDGKSAHEVVAALSGAERPANNTWRAPRAANQRADSRPRPRSPPVTRIDASPGNVTGTDGAGNIIVISGNHGNKVWESPYPKSRVLGYVIPRETN